MPYFGSIEYTLIEVPLEEITHDEVLFHQKKDREEISVPTHRIRIFKKKGTVIWRREA